MTASVYLAVANCTLEFLTCMSGFQCPYILAMLEASDFEKSLQTQQLICQRNTSSGLGLVSIVNHHKFDLHTRRPAFLLSVLLSADATIN
jgi:hypothetical protein